MVTLIDRMPSAGVALVGAEPEALSVHERFEAEACARPDAVAVCGDRTVTYGELNRRANRIARQLRDNGVGPEVLVGICGERSPEIVAGILGVLKAGGGYVALDVNYPIERLRYMIDHARISVALVTPAAASRLPISGLTQLSLEWDDLASAARADRPVASETTLDNICTVIYTSGSTGEPKGVAVTHGAVLARAGNGAAYASHQIPCQKASLSVIAHISDLIMPLVAGFPVVIIGDDQARSATAFARVMRDHGLTRAMFVPSQLWAILENGNDALADLRHLDTVVTSGEALTPALVHAFKTQFPDTTLVNAYGLSETTGAVTLDHVADADRIVIGRPVAGARVYVFDDNMDPVPPGAVGELYVAGPQLTRGYLRRPVLTAECFVPHPSGEPGERLYRTGDMARYVEDGTIEWLGRRDFEVKVRGFRINLNDLEFILERHESVSRAVVVVGGGEGSPRLAAFIVGQESGSRVDVAALRRHLSQSLPVHMIPTSFYVVDSVALLPNGKVDRRLLAASTRGDTRAAAADPDAPAPVAPRTSAERACVAIWSDVLGVGVDSVDQNFFEAGGDSLSAMQVADALMKRCKVAVSVEDIFNRPTIAAISRLIDERIERRPKLSCLWATAARALGTHDLDPSVRNPDWLAAPLLGDAERSLLADNATMIAFERDDADARREADSALRYMLQRTRFVDEHLQEACARGATQIVLLGAGFDSRPYRLRPLLRNTRVFEVDHASTQRRKRQRIQEVLGRPPSNVVYVPVDLSRQSLATSLARRGYRADERTCFIWEGVAMYLPEPAVRETLRFVATRSAPGSSIVFDYWTLRHVQEAPLRDEFVRNRFVMADAWGEPVMFGLPEGTEGEFLEECGLTLVEQLPFHGHEAISRYLTRADGTRVGNVSFPPPPFPLGYPGTWMAVASVRDGGTVLPEVQS